MRALALALALSLPLACASQAPPRDAAPPGGYNRRELPPTDGLLTGPDGVWTIYQSGTDASRKEEKAPKSEP